LLTSFDIIGFIKTPMGRTVLVSLTTIGSAGLVILDNHLARSSDKKDRDGRFDKLQGDIKNLGGRIETAAA
jgi:hypothetical protein